MEYDEYLRGLDIFERTLIMNARDKLNLCLRWVELQRELTRVEGVLSQDEEGYVLPGIMEIKYTAGKRKLDYEGAAKAHIDQMRSAFARLTESPSPGDEKDDSDMELLHESLEEAQDILEINTSDTDKTDWEGLVELLLSGRKEEEITSIVKQHPVEETDWKGVCKDLLILPLVTKQHAGKLSFIMLEQVTPPTEAPDDK